MFIRRVNIFLLSLCMIVAPTLTFAIDAPIPPFTSASAAGDIAASLGKRPTGGFPVSVATGLSVAAAIGVGVGSYCLASMAIGNSAACGAGSPICNALMAAGIGCKPNPDGTFPKLSSPIDPTKPSDMHKYLYSLEPIAWKRIGEIHADLKNKTLNNPDWHIEAVTFAPTTEPYTSANTKQVRNDGYVYNEPSGLKWMLDSNPPPDVEEEGNADPSDVGAAVAASPSAANAMGAAANAVANSGSNALGQGGANPTNCNGSLGTFNGVSTCVPNLGASDTPSCKGFAGVVSGESVCVPALGAGGNPACNGFSGTVNGESKCIPEIGNNPACSGYFGTFNGKPVCVGGVSTPDFNPNIATQEANAAASSATSNPPSSRTCPNGFKLDSSGICLSTTIPERGNADCKIGFIFYGNNCVAADPLNPYKPATANASAVPTTTSTTVTTHPTTGVRTTTVTTSEVRDGANVQTRVVTTTFDPATGAETKTDTGALPNPNVSTPQNPALPAFCGWAAIVCDFVGWVKKEPTAPASTTVNVTAIGVTGTALDNYDISQQRVNFSEQCPVPINFSFDFMGHTQPLAFSFEPFCEFLTKIKPIIIACAYVGGAYIVSGATRKSDS